MILKNMGDGIEGSRIWIEFRKIKKPTLFHGTGGHKAQRTKVEGLPAIAIIEKPIKAKSTSPKN